MKTKIEKVSNCKRKLTVEVPKEDAQQDYMSVLKNFQSEATLRGFRKGKVPLPILENLYKEQVKASYLEEYIPRYYQKALLELGEEGGRPITRGDLENFKWELGKPLNLAFNFEVKPTIGLKNYTDLEVPFTPIKVTKEMIAEELKRLQENYAKVEEKENGSAEKKDIIYYTVVSYNNKSIEEQDEQPYQIGSKAFGEKFDKDITGKKKGDMVDTVLEVKSGENKQDVQTYPISIKITSVKKVIIPKLNDDFAKDVGDYESLKELKAVIKKNLEEEVEERNRQGKRSQILQEIIKQNPFELPQDFIKEYVDEMIARAGQQNKNISEDEIKNLREKYKEYVENELKVIYTLEKLRKLEKVEVTPEEIEEAIKKNAQRAGMDVEKYKELYKNQIDREMIKQEIANDKILDKIAVSVKFVKNKQVE
jgi:trigger factor